MMSFDTCVHHENITTINIMDISVTSKSFLVVLCNFCLYPPGPLPSQASTDLLSVTIDSFLFSRILHKWNHTLCILFCLTSFILRFYLDMAPINHIWFNSMYHYCLSIQQLLDTVVFCFCFCFCFGCTHSTRKFLGKHQNQAYTTAVATPSL